MVVLRFESEGSLWLVGGSLLYREKITQLQENLRDFGGTHVLLLVLLTRLF